MKTAVEEWLATNPDTSSDYKKLVDRLRAGEQVECVIELNGKSRLARAEFKKTQWGGLFVIVTSDDEQDAFMNSSFNQFLNFCESVNLIFAKYDFLKNTRKMLEIAKNAAEFKPVFVPLNTVDDVNALLDVFEKAEVNNGCL